jgi:hypothetical protein
VTKNTSGYVHPVDRLLKMGLRRWDEGLLLLPPDMLALVPNGTILTTILGEKKIKGTSYISTDVRYGVLAIGITVKQWDQALEWFRTVRVPYR